MTVLIASDRVRGQLWPPEVFAVVADECGDALPGDEAQALHVVAREAAWFVEVQAHPDELGVSAVLVGDDDGLLAVATTALGVCAVSAHRVVEGGLTPVVETCAVDLPAGTDDVGRGTAGPALLDLCVAARDDQLWQEVRLLLWCEDGELFLVGSEPAGKAELRPMDVHVVSQDLCGDAVFPSPVPALLVDVIEAAVAVCSPPAPVEA